MGNFSKNTYFIVFALLLIASGSAQEKSRVISGKVSDGTLPIRNVAVENKQRGLFGRTDELGKYSIKAMTNDVLVFHSVGLDTLRIKVEDVTRFLNLTMQPRVVALDEVTVTKKKKSLRDREFEYIKNKNLVKTSYGIYNAEKSGFAGKVIDGSELALGAPDFSEAIRNKLSAGARILDGRPTDGTSSNGILSFGKQIFLRGGVSISGRYPVVYDVDGMILKSSPDFLSIADIDRVLVLPSLGAVAKYGKAGRGGVIVINTKSGNYTPDKETGMAYDYALRRDNIYKDSVLSIKEVKKREASYLSELLAAENENAAKGTFLKYEPTYKGSYPFLLEYYKHFLNSKNNKTFANTILKDNWAVFKTNPVALKGLAYILQENQEYEKANEIYKNIYLLRPTYAQSYIDLANSYEEIGNYNKAAALLTRYNYLTREGFFQQSEADFSELVNRELNDLIALYGKDILPSEQYKELTSIEKGKGKRLVFEWNDSETEFELQFVSPNKNYAKWEHTLNQTPKIIADEKNLGYSMSEHFIDNSLKGNWKVNVTYLGNKQLTPSYLKVTIYHNYGLPSQNKEVNVYRLGLRNVNHQLFDLNNSGVVSSN